tara:strand:- start:294 stop:1091 length:798 start_codon:yes stop_codon:yes gene_type:complete
VSLALTSCNTQISQPLSSNNNLKRSFEVNYITGNEFEIYSAQTQMTKNPVLTVYLEGDGFAWKSRTKLSDDPTPKNPIALKLAIKANKPDTIYLARPCQYGAKHAGKKCSNVYWSSHRFSDEIVEAVSSGITKLKKENKKKQIKLVGFSGGAAIAVLIAARRDDVSAVFTVAGNLNSKMIMEQHGVSPLVGSLEPLDFAFDIRNIPQIHFYGEKDKIISSDITKSFFKASGFSNCVQIIPVKNASHNKQWQNNWQKISNFEPKCY